MSELKERLKAAQARVAELQDAFNAEVQRLPADGRAARDAELKANSPKWKQAKEEEAKVTAEYEAIAKKLREARAKMNGMEEGYERKAMEGKMRQLMNQLGLPFSKPKEPVLA